MAYILTLPTAMRVFRPTIQNSKMLARTGDALHAGEVIKISDVVVVFYDHRDKLGLKLDQDDRHLLVEEIDDEIRSLTYIWTGLGDDVVNGPTPQARLEAKDAQAEVIKRLAPLMRKYIRPELQVVGSKPMAAPDREGPGIHLVLW